MSDVITIVSGLPRSGTSMMMKMLDAGGVHPITDNIRTADEDNPKGYYEFEAVKKMKDDVSWVPDARGKAVKVISQLLADLPPSEQYRVIFMRREIQEILASQKQMLIRRGTWKEGGPSDDKMADIMLRHVDQVLSWMGEQANVQHIEVSYNEMLADPTTAIGQIKDLLGGGIEIEGMAAVVDPGLYRQRR